MGQHRRRWKMDRLRLKKPLKRVVMAPKFLADLILIIHFVYLATVIIPALIIPIGFHRHWRWVRSQTVRAIHMGMMGFVLLEVLIGMICPLTWLESHFLEASGRSGYQGTFMTYWLSQIMYWDAPSWIFTAAYAIFFAWIIYLWRAYPPGPIHGR
jgi:hypothetical protein